MLRSAVAAFATLLLMAISPNSPAFAQDKPADFLRRLLPTLGEEVPPGDWEPLERTPAAPIDPNASAKLCFWKDTSVSGFGKSGFCEVSSQLAVGAACQCQSGGGRPKFKGDGTVILAPDSNQSSDLVR